MSNMAVRGEGLRWALLAIPTQAHESVDLEWAHPEKSPETRDL